MTDVTRTYLLEPGEGLLFTADPWQWAARTELFEGDTGISHEAVYAAPLFAHPVPMRPAEGSWRGVKTTMLWHPMLWLPEHLARPGQFPEGKDGQDIEEDIAEWAFRVMLELAQAGLYDPGTGEWVDVLARVGIDLSMSDGVMRVQAWQDGAADVVLDAFSIESMLDQTQEPGWARAAARSEAWAMREAQWSRTANALLNFATENPDDQPPVQLAKVLAETAAASFQDIAADPDTGDDYALSFRGYAFEAARLDPTLEYRVDYVLNAVKLQLIEIEEIYRASRERVFRTLTPPTE